MQVLINLHRDCAQNASDIIRTIHSHWASATVESCSASEMPVPVDEDKDVETEAVEERMVAYRLLPGFDAMLLLPMVEAEIDVDRPPAGMCKHVIACSS